MWCSVVQCGALAGIPSRLHLGALQAIEAAKLALLSSVVFGPAGIAMVAVAYSSKRWGERSMHVGVSCFCTGIALL